MKAICLLLFVAVASAARVKPVPQFPLDWTANEEDFAVVYQGQYVQQGDLYCCGDDSCEVQTEYSAGMDYFDYTHNRTRFDDPVNGNIVSLFNPVYKEMLVDASNTCQSFCPIEDDLEPYGIDPNATYMGQKVIDNKTLDDWQYEDKEFGIVFEIDNVYVDPTSELPYTEIDQLTPFGQAIGEESEVFHTFVPGTPDPSHFAVKNVDGCPMDPNCGQSFRQGVRRRWGLRLTWMKYHQANNMAKLKAARKRTNSRRPRPVPVQHALPKTKPNRRH